MTQKQIVSVARVVDMYLSDEQTNYEENNKPQNHIYLDLLRLRRLALREVIKKYATIPEQN